MSQLSQVPGQKIWYGFDTLLLLNEQQGIESPADCSAPNSIPLEGNTMKNFVLSYIITTLTA